MTRKGAIILLLFLSWVIGNIHRLWNNTEPVITHPFPYDKDYPVTWHWYIHTILKDVSFLSISFALWLYIRSNMRRDRDVIIAFGAVFLNQIIDLPHYILAARHSEKTLDLQGAIMLGAAIIMVINAKIKK